MKNPILKAAARCLFAAVLGASTSLFGQPTPVLHLSFDNVTGTTVFNDGSGSGMDGTMNGTASIVPGGMFGNCLQVTGAGSADGSVRIASAVVPLNVQAGSTWTVACWIKSSTQGGTWMYQGDGGWASGNTTLAMLVNNGSAGVNGPAAGGVRYASGWEQGTAIVNNGQWHHIVLTWDGTTKLQYIDGILDTWVADQWANSVGTGAQFWVGGGGPGEGDGQTGLQGLLDEAYVFDVALSASDIQKLYTINSLTGTPVPAAVTVSPKSGLRGTVITVTATATPTSGTVTNATANLGALGLSSAAPLVESSPNVFTNSFTIPTNAPIGLHNVIVTVHADTAPLVGTASTNFFVLATPPTNATVVTQLTSKSAYVGTEVSFHFAATNDAPNSTNNAFFPMTYAWYTNGVLVSTNPMGPYYTFLTEPDNNNLPIQCIARINDDTNYYSVLTVTSAPVILTITAGTPVYTNGLKEEVFSGVTSRANVEIGNTGPGAIHLVSAADTGSAGGVYGDNTSRRYSGYFIPPTSDNYVFFLASDDDCDLFLSTNDLPANKLLIAQEYGYSAPDGWNTIGGNGSIAGQKRSDQWTNSASANVAPYAGGIPLLAGHKYYIESVEHNGTGGDNWGVTYETETELTADPLQPADASPSRMTAANQNIAVATWPGTTLGWLNDLTPANTTVLEGFGTNFTFLATNDAEMAVTYQGYINDVPYPGATSTNFILANIPTSYNGARIYVVASNPEGGLSITSRVAILHVTPSVHEPGFIKDERWDGYTVANLLNNTVPPTPNYQEAVTEWGVGQDNAGGHDNFVRRISGYFVPPGDVDVTNYYNFVTTSDDDSILFLSTDETPGKKVEVCKQNGWNGGARWDWGAIGGGAGSGEAAMTHSDTYTSDGNNGTNALFSGGIPLAGGHRYYIEQDMHQGGGGANVAATYYVFGNSLPAIGTETLFKGSTIQTSVPRCSYVAFTKEPQNIANAKLGSSVGFLATGDTDSKVSIGGINGYEENYAGHLLFFQWYTNGVAVPGANTATYILGPVTSDMVGFPVMCQMRALGFTDDALNPIWTNSTTVTITSVLPAAPPGLIGHFISGTADLNDSANYVAPGLYYGVPARATTSSQFYYFTNDVPPGATAGAVALHINNDAIAITNTCTSDPGYTVDTFDGGIKNAFTVMAWAKGSLSGWNSFVTKGGDNGIGWAIRTGSDGGRACWTLRGSGGTEDMQGPSENDSNWHHYAGTYDLNGSITNITAVTNADTSVTYTTNVLGGGIRTLYVDGVQKGQYTGQTAYTPAAGHVTLGTEDLSSGNSYGNNGYITGNIYDVRIYNYALTQAQIITAGNILPKRPVFGGGPVSVTTGPNGPQFVLTYTNATLLSSTNVGGPFTAVAGATSPYTNILNNATPDVFFKLSIP